MSFKAQSLLQLLDGATILWGQTTWDDRVIVRLKATNFISFSVVYCTGLLVSSLSNNHSVSHYGNAPRSDRLWKHQCLNFSLDDSKVMLLPDPAFIP